jgi:hypothetical protein
VTVRLESLTYTGQKRRGADDSVAPGAFVGNGLGGLTAPGWSSSPKGEGPTGPSAARRPGITAYGPIGLMSGIVAMVLLVESNPSSLNVTV